MGKTQTVKPFLDLEGYWFPSPIWKAISSSKGFYIKTVLSVKKPKVEGLSFRKHRSPYYNFALGALQHWVLVTLAWVHVMVRNKVLHTRPLEQPETTRFGPCWNFQCHQSNMEPCQSTSRRSRLVTSLGVLKRRRLLNMKNLTKSQAGPREEITVTFPLEGKNCLQKTKNKALSYVNVSPVYLRTSPSSCVLCPLCPQQVAGRGVAGAGSPG